MRERTFATAERVAAAVAARLACSTRTAPPSSPPPPRSSTLPLGRGLRRRRSVDGGTARARKGCRGPRRAAATRRTRRRPSSDAEAAKLLAGGARAADLVRHQPSTYPRYITRASTSRVTTTCPTGSSSRPRAAARGRPDLPRSIAAMTRRMMMLSITQKKKTLRTTGAHTITRSSSTCGYAAPALDPRDDVERAVEREDDGRRQHLLRPP